MGFLLHVFAAYSLQRKELETSLHDVGGGGDCNDSPGPDPLLPRGALLLCQEAKAPALLHVLVQPILLFTGPALAFQAPAGTVQGLPPPEQGVPPAAVPLDAPLTLSEHVSLARLCL